MDERKYCGAKLGRWHYAVTTLLGLVSASGRSVQTERGEVTGRD
jgi:hypothetical protein